ncbi:hypothetical protein TRVL_08225 [Trypanosoma vivax]|nr:hypothetical protein TRVL_08225 [Trypanosoma vivax]
MLNSGSLSHSCASSSRSKLAAFLATSHAVTLIAHTSNSFHFRNTILPRRQCLQHMHILVAVQTHPSHATSTRTGEGKVCSHIACGLASTRHASIAAPRHVVHPDPTSPVKKYFNSLHPTGQNIV